MTDRERFATAISVLGATFNRELTGAALEGYWLALQTLTPEELSRATKRTLAESKFMPAPAELLAFAGRQPRNVDTEAALCWQAVRKAIDEHDWSVASIDFGARVNAVVRNLGGWDTLCTAKLSELDNPGWLRKRFEEVYGLFANKDPMELNGAALLGSAEARQLRGASHAVVRIEGQPAPRAGLLSSESPGAGRLVRELAEQKSA